MSITNRSEQQHREIERWLSRKIIGFIVMTYGMLVTTASLAFVFVLRPPSSFVGLSGGYFLIRFGAKLATAKPSQKSSAS